MRQQGQYGCHRSPQRTLRSMHLPPSSSSRRSSSQPSHGKTGASAAAESLYQAAPTTLRAAAIRACRMRSVSSNPPPRSRSCVRGSWSRQRVAARGKSRRAVGRGVTLSTGTPICTVIAHRAEKSPATTPCAIHEVSVAPQPVASPCLAVVPLFFVAVASPLLATCEDQAGSPAVGRSWRKRTWRGKDARVSLGGTQSLRMRSSVRCTLVHCTKPHLQAPV